MNTINLINTLPKRLKPMAKFISMQEAESGLSHSRFIQDTAVNWAPKAIFSRSKADLAEMSLLEFAESILVYYFPTILGEKIFRKVYSHKLDNGLKKLISKPASELLKDKNLKAEDRKKLMPIKAAISVSALAIPLAEYSLNYIKNLFTLKIFKQADFNKIANLDKSQKDDKEKQEKVKRSAIKHLKIAGGLFAGCLALSTLLVTKGRNSKALNTISEFVLTPGNKIFSKNEKKAATFNKYFSLDFSDNKGKLGLSRGQLTACVLAGFFGYTGAAKDRGKQNLLEVLFRYPLVGFYVITGSELFEKGFKAILKKNGKCEELIGQNLEVPKLKELSQLAEKLAKSNGTATEAEFKKLFKQKALISSVPFLFSIGFMGMFVAGVSRFFTQYRYNNDLKKNLKTSNISFNKTSFDEFKKQVKNN